MVLKVDKALKDGVVEAAVEEEGPTDGTVAVASTDSQMLSDENADAVLEIFAQHGEIILVRLVKLVYWCIDYSLYTLLAFIHTEWDFAFPGKLLCTGDDVINLKCGLI